MGKDKFENEDLIKYGFPEDVWFHIDKLSSAHVYLRLQPGQDWAEIPKELLVDCAQLVKSNSIDGNKKNNIAIVYMPWDNLKKMAGIETGQVSFHKLDKVKRIHVKICVNAIVNRLNKTKEEREPDLAVEKLARDKKDQLQSRQAEFSKRAEEERQAEQKWKAKKQVDDFFSKVNMKSNWRDKEVENVAEYEEDF
ncbi:hypothetical protein BC938DRAFT_480415, partial [Jimgerdemannia flammicorona]